MGSGIELTKSVAIYQLIIAFGTRLTNKHIQVSSVYCRIYCSVNIVWKFVFLLF